MRRVISLFLPLWPSDRLRRQGKDAPPRDKPLVTARMEGQRRVLAVEQLGEASREVARVVHEEIFSCDFGASPEAPGGLMERAREARGRVRPAPALACSGRRLAQRERPSCAIRCRAVDSALERVKANLTFLPKRA